MPGPDLDLSAPLTVDVDGRRVRVVSVDPGRPITGVLRGPGPRVTLRRRDVESRGDLTPQELRSLRRGHRLQMRRGDAWVPVEVLSDSAGCPRIHVGVRQGEEVVGYDLSVQEAREVLRREADVQFDTVIVDQTGDPRELVALIITERMGAALQGLDALVGREVTITAELLTTPGGNRVYRHRYQVDLGASWQRTVASYMGLTEEMVRSLRATCMDGSPLAEDCDTFLDTAREFDEDSAAAGDRIADVINARARRTRPRLEQIADDHLRELMRDPASPPSIRWEAQVALRQMKTRADFWLARRASARQACLDYWNAGLTVE